MKILRLILVGSLLLTSASFINASSLDKIRAKQLADDNKDGVVYKKITTKKELEEFKKNGGMNLDKTKNKKVLNYVEIKNVRESNIGGKKIKRGLNKDSINSDNVGVVGTLKSGDKVTNIVDIKNSKLKSKNFGVDVEAKNITGVNVDSNVNIKNSKIGGN